jgi:hypothetical protein
MLQQNQLGSVSLSATATIPELQQSKMAVLNTLASRHSRRSYEYAIDSFIAWYCGEPRLEFNRSVVVRYHSFLERLSLSVATINLHLSAIRRLADEFAERRLEFDELKESSGSDSEESRQHTDQPII